MALKDFLQKKPHPLELPGAPDRYVVGKGSGDTFHLDDFGRMETRDKIPEGKLIIHDKLTNRTQVLDENDPKLKDGIRFLNGQQPGTPALTKAEKEQLEGKPPTTTEKPRPVSQRPTEIDGKELKETLHQAKPGDRLEVDTHSSPLHTEMKVHDAPKGKQHNHPAPHTKPEHKFPDSKGKPWEHIPQPGRDPAIHTPPPSASELSGQVAARHAKEATPEQKAIAEYYKQNAGNAGFDLKHLHDMPKAEDIDAPLKMADPDGAKRAVEAWAKQNHVPAGMVDSVNTMIDQQQQPHTGKEQMKAGLHMTESALENVRAAMGRPVTPEAHKAFNDALDTLVDDLGKPKSSKEHAKLEADLKKLDPELFSALQGTFLSLDKMQDVSAVAADAHDASEHVKPKATPAHKAPAKGAHRSAH